jgi:type II secretory pathway pseudopilin PulG
MNRKKCNISCGGISMVELVMALSIIAVLASTATLSFRGSIAQAELQQAADRLIADLRLVRDQAKSDQQSYSLKINTVTLRYQAVGVMRLKSPQDISENLAAPPYRLTSITLLLDGNDTITFDARGNASPVGEVILRRGSKQKTIKIHASGQIEQAD